MALISVSCTDASTIRPKKSPSGTTGSSGAQTAAGSGASAALHKSATELMKKYCYQCHGLNQSNSGSLTNITDLAQKVSEGQIIAGDPEKSKIFERMISKTSPMPPAGASKPTPDELEMFKKWIAEGAQTQFSGASSRPLVSEEKILTDAGMDLVKEIPDSAERKKYRYLTLAAAQNAGASDETLQTMRQAIAKVLNSVSKTPEVYAPKFSSKNPLLVRFSLDDLGWTNKEWEMIIKRYPYQIVPIDKKILSVLQEQTGTSIPVVRADWLIATASRPPLYYELLESPSKLPDFFKMLGIDLATEQKEKRIMRAGFSNSEVAEHARVIERVVSQDNIVVWHSYEFGSSMTDKDPFKMPLGPGTIFGTIARGLGFKPDGREIIYTLPNSFLAFYIADHNEQRLDEAPTRARNTDFVSGVAVAGIACMTCHSQGLLEKQDQIRNAVLKRTDLSQDAVEIVRSIYTEPGPFNSKIKEDTVSYQTALKQAGVDFTKPDPISKIFKTFNDSVTLRAAAGELGVSEESVKNAVDSSQNLTNALSALTTDASVTRAAFSSNFQELMTAVFK